MVLVRLRSVDSTIHGNGAVAIRFDCTATVKEFLAVVVTALRRHHEEKFASARVAAPPLEVARLEMEQQYFRMIGSHDELVASARGMITFANDFEIRHRGRVIPPLGDCFASSVMAVFEGVKDGDELILRRRNRAHRNDESLFPDVSPISKAPVEAQLSSQPSDDDGAVTPIKISRIASSPNAGRVLQPAFQNFLTKIGLSWFAPFLSNAGVSTLGELCTWSASRLSRLLVQSSPPTNFVRSCIDKATRVEERSNNDTRSKQQGGVDCSTIPKSVPFQNDVFCFELITAAHEHMKRLGLTVDWRRRIVSYVECTDPAAALTKITSEIDQTVLESHGSVEALEVLWWKKRELYEEHLLNVVESLLRKDHCSLRRFFVERAAEELSACSATERRADGGFATSGTAPRTSTDENQAVGIVTNFPVSEELLVPCPQCEHLFRYTPPALPFRIKEAEALRQRALEELHLTRQQHALVTQGMEESLRGLQQKLNAAEAAKNHWESIASSNTERLKGLEGENADLRRLLVAAQQRASERESAAAPSRSIVEQFESSSRKPSGAATIPPISADERRRIRRAVVEYLYRQNPDSVMMADHIMHQWRGREGELERLLLVPRSKAIDLVAVADQIL